MTKWQKLIALVGAAAAGLAALFPPYDLPGDIVPDIQYGPLWHRPVSGLEGYVGTRGELFVGLWVSELGVIALVTAALLLCLRRTGAVPARQAMGGGALLPPPSDYP